MTRIIFSLLTSIAALLGANAATAQSPLAANAPDSHVVVPGDTLWGISGKFLKEPWRWPEVWRMNREQIRNPHLIYPGQVVYLDRSGPYLRLGKQVGDPLYEKRFPQAYSESLTGPITSISIDAIKPFLSQPLVVDEEGLANSATVIAVDENQVFAGKGDTIFGSKIGIVSINRTRKSHAQVKSITANGVAGTKMKGYEGKLSDTELDDVAAFVKSLR